MSFFHALFSKYKCLIYTAFGHEKYLQIVHKLRAAGVQFRTRTYSQESNQLGSQTFGFFPRNDFTQYDIYVKKEDEHKALMAIHGK
ncbi:hypothetical protein BRE01_30360 [Brevibacillus reuszeri]|uniref:DUF2007 domain-containing protein n=1 Tax=Brevibacillus reuszeri TaxID=54915 RepID=A0A0K9YJF8_9BACL|nr:hypothetical protein [Brevibacillus reuszeri]KNB68809.1 hypothetical protein ADS79_33185 [Brevibacillus reuszeri]MED1859116.1 hypothetical protein [Brevibacillus reuszeri]GED69334.1 hypothetical protein BRE01_30360 [Brevibacillus reuszeri]